MYPIDGLIFNRRRPPAVGQDDDVGGHKVEADGANGEGGEHDCAGGVGFEGYEGGVALGCFHGAVDAGVVVIVLGELGGDDVEEGGPLAEDDNLGAWIAIRRFQDTQQSLDFGAATTVLIELGG